MKLITYDTHKFLLFLVGCFSCFQRNCRLIESDSSTFFNFQNKSVTIEFRHMTMCASNGYYIIAFFNFLDKLLLFFGLLLLRTNHKEVKNENDPTKDYVLKVLLGLWLGL